MRQRTLLFPLLAIAMLGISGCASQPEEIGSQSVSPLIYQNYDCDQIVLEMDRVSRRTGVLYTELKTLADNDSAQMGVGLLLLWPTLFALEGGDGPQATEYARLKGEHEALHQAAIAKKCDLSLVKPIEEYTTEQKSK